ncbi:DUF302 domain-containing protein [Falsibacillus pallidus]|uniref:Uncharacterized protein (DUF302 family) n=1 Tax=Falsibacillus pallidus TaxID=493781 RepID=A0A370G8J8_9BACI|nr:DUF302 domain-containing protein [Falsibacillus pallidus]RDI40087.1 uncharacterized protein (DUF302 family) [Falsibacillus pallidus]
MSFGYTVETSKGMDDAVQALEQALKEEKFGVLWDFDLAGKLREKGKDFPSGYRVLEVCNPDEAEKVLSKDKQVGYFLPCKIVVYEEDGKTKIGMPNPTTLIELANDPELNEIAADVENRLKKSIDNAK